MSVQDNVWSAIVVDDERLARKRIETLLEDDREIHVTASLDDPCEAISVVGEHLPDLLFVDVQMPGVDGIEMIRRIPAEAMPLVVFVTAYDEYAVRAFDLHAVDYVLKPVDEERFAVALTRAKERLRHEQSGRRGDPVQRLLASHAAPAKLERIVVQSRGRMRLLRFDEVEWIQSAANYVRVFAGGREHLLRETIASLEAKLDPRQFVRIHRSTIVNVEFIEELVPRAFGDFTVHLRGGAELTMSRRFRSRVEPLIGKL